MTLLVIDRLDIVIRDVNRDIPTRCATNVILRYSKSTIYIFDDLCFFLCAVFRLSRFFTLIEMSLLLVHGQLNHTFVRYSLSLNSEGF